MYVRIICVNIFVSFFALIGLPIAFALGITSAIGIWVYLSPTQLSQMANVSYLQGTSFTLMVAPLFILMSELISNGGISKDIFDVLSRWFKKVPGVFGNQQCFCMFNFCRPLWIQSCNGCNDWQD